jgi:RNA polymerase sigma-70 factor (ECF subfamily)
MHHNVRWSTQTGFSYTLDPMTPDDPALLHAHRPMLLKFALRQLRNLAWAEDAVSETLLAAVARPQAFEQRSQWRTWLVGILKHKVLDQLRLHARDACDPGTDPDELADPLDDMPFNARGHYAQPLTPWGNPEQDLQRRELFEVLELCTDRLPPAQGRAFMMREWLELSVDDICKELGVSPTNLYVLLHRARLRLRECMQIHWFGTAAP